MNKINQMSKNVFLGSEQWGTHGNGTIAVAEAWSGCETSVRAALCPTPSKLGPLLGGGVPGRLEIFRGLKDCFFLPQLRAWCFLCHVSQQAGIQSAVSSSSAGPVIRPLQAAQSWKLVELRCCLVRKPHNFEHDHRETY